MRAYSRLGDDGVHTLIEVGRENMYVTMSRDDSVITAHVPKCHALEIAENLMFVLKSNPA